MWPCCPNAFSNLTIFHPLDNIPIIGLYTYHSTHRGRHLEAFIWRSGVRSPRAGFASLLPGGSGHRVGRHYGRSARCSLDGLAKVPVPGNPARNRAMAERLWREPRWSAARRACLLRKAQGMRRASQARQSKDASCGAPLPHSSRDMGIRAQQSRVYPRLENMDSQIGQGRSGCAGTKIRGERSVG